MTEKKLSLEALLKLGDPVFKKLNRVWTNLDRIELNDLLNSPQPGEWIKEFNSDLIPGRIYFYNEISLIESLMDKCFPGWYYSIDSNSIMQDKGKFSSTTIVSVYYRIGSFEKIVMGVSSSFAESIQHLSLATPLSVTEARKNAIKQIGDFFGKSINRNIENAPLPVMQIKKEDKEQDDEFEKVKAKIISMSKADAEMYLPVCGFKYNLELKEIINLKKIK